MHQEIDWAPVINDLGPALYAYFCVSFSPAHADDLVQSTLIRLIEKYRGGSFDPNKGSLRMYAYGIAHFVRLEGLRSIEHTEDVNGEHLADSNATADAQLEQQARARRLRQAIRQLGEVQQQVLNLYLDEELSQEEIGYILQMPLNTVKSHIHRAKEELRRSLNE